MYGEWDTSSVSHLTGNLSDAFGYRQELRPAVFALRAFNIELAAIADQVRAAMADLAVIMPLTETLTRSNCACVRHDVLPLGRSRSRCSCQCVCNGGAMA